MGTTEIDPPDGDAVTVMLDVLDLEDALAASSIIYIATLAVIGPFDETHTFAPLG